MSISSIFHHCTIFPYTIHVSIIFHCSLWVTLCANSSIVKIQKLHHPIALIIFYTITKANTINTFIALAIRIIYSICIQKWTTKYNNTLCRDKITIRSWFSISVNRITIIAVISTSCYITTNKVIHCVTNIKISK